MRSRTASWFETKIKYQKCMEDGSEKVVNELYVVDALSCTEAETSVIEEMSCYISGDSAVTSAKKTNYGEIFFSDLDDDDKCTRQNSSLSLLMRNPIRRDVLTLLTWFRLSRWHVLFDTLMRRWERL